MEIKKWLPKNFELQNLKWRSEPLKNLDNVQSHASLDKSMPLPNLIKPTRFNRAQSKLTFSHSKVSTRYSRDFAHRFVPRKVCATK